MPSLAQSGRIDRIEVYNFKSYKGHQVIGPFRNFTAIIGPNGAGKSNLMDAISFVLGVRSVHLRGDKLRDLVYSLGDGDVEKEERRAHVMLVYIHGNGEELRLLRGITGAGSSEYRINGSAVTWEEYNEKLKSIGVLVKARNFLVFQGDVESIASKSPRELTTLFEQISGSEELRKEYERLEAEKLRAEEKVMFSFQKKKTTTAEKRQRKEQKEEAEKHLELQKQLKEKRTELYLWQLSLNEQERAAAEAAVAEANQQLERVKQDQRVLEARMAEKTKEAALYSKEVLAREKRAVKREAEIEKKRPELLRLKEARKRAQKKQEEERVALRKRQEAEQKQQEEIARMERDVEHVQAELEELEGQRGQEEGGVQLAQTQMEDYMRLKARVGTSTIQLKQERAVLARQQGADMDAQARLEANLQQVEERERQLRGKAEEMEVEAGRVGKDLAGFEQQLEQLKGEETSLLDHNRHGRHRQETLQARLEEAERRLREAKAERRENEREQRSAEAVAAMRRLFPGVHGRLSDLCRTTQRKYQLAATVTLGKLFDAVAVDAEETAKDCIQYLRDQRLPPMTFIPLATARVKPLQERLRTLGGSAKLVADILTFNEVLKTAVLYAVGNTLVCDTLEEARTLAWGGRERLKVVTLDGTLLSKNGNMTGGTSGSIEERAKRLQNADQNIDGLREARDSIAAELEQLGSVRDAQAKEQEVRSKIAGLQRKIHYAQLELRTAQEKGKQARDELAALVQERERIQPELAKLAASLDSRGAEMSRAEARMNEIVDRVFRDFCAAVGVANIREYEDVPLRHAQLLAERRLRLQNQAAKLRNQLEYERHRDTRGPVEALEASLEAGEVELRRLASESEEVKAALEAMLQQLKDLEASVAEAKEKATAAEDELQVMAKEASALTAKLGKAKRNASAKEAVLVQQQARHKELLETCELEQISLRTAAGESIPVEAESNGTPAVPTELLDYSALPRRLRQAMGKEAQERVLEEMRVQLEEINAELERTAPNLKALEQYEAVREKEREATEEFETVRKEAKTVTDAFLQVKQERLERFRGAFEHISGIIDRIYKDLTASRTHPLGGSAYLSLESEEEPFLAGIKFTAMPPTKRFRDMVDLSGGEKTVAALALLFAIHSFRPSPFFVLDEVDAALDNLNVAKVASYIHSKSRDEALTGTAPAIGAPGRRSRGSLGREDEPTPVAGFQSIVISLKDQFYDKADALVGVYRDQEESCSKVLTFDLTKYPV